MSRLPSVFEPLDKTADAIIAEARSADLEVRQRVLDSLSDGLGLVANALSVLTWELKGDEHEGHSRSINDAASSIRSAASFCGDVQHDIWKETRPELH